MTSGKTTLATKLMELHPKFVKVAFAAPIYDLAREYFGMVEKDRDLLIHIGEAFRAKDEAVWTKAFLRKVAKLEAEGKWILVDDLRMPQEHQVLRENGFRLIRLNVSVAEQERRLKSKYPNTFEEHIEKREHLTESALDEEYDWDLYATQDAPHEWVYNIASVFSAAEQ